MGYKFNPFTGNFDIVPNNPPVSSQTGLASSFSLTIDTTVPFQTIYISASAQRTVSGVYPFGTTAPIDGAEITLVGGDNDLYPRILSADVAKGYIGPTIDLFKNETITVKYIAAADRFVLVSRSN